jgi:hypothetical protein
VASEWAAEIQPEYMHEFNFRGAALGGLPPNILEVIDTVTGGPFAGLVPSALLGLTSQWPKAHGELIGKLRTSGPYNRTAFLEVKNMTAAEAFATFVNQSIYDYFENGKADLHTGAIKTALDRDGIMGQHGVPRMPLFVYKAIADELSPIGSTDALVRDYCNHGARIFYQRNTVGGHLAEEMNGDSRALEWLVCVLDGKECYTGLGQTCTTQNVTVNITTLAA